MTDFSSERVPSIERAAADVEPLQELPNDPSVISTPTDTQETIPGTVEDAEDESLSREQQLLSCVGLARWLASRSPRTSYVTGDHLESFALYQLTIAARSFDPGKKTKFETYAGNKVRQNLKKVYRDEGSIVRTPRPLQKNSTTLRYVEGNERQHLKREPTNAEVVVASSLSEQEVEECRLLRRPVSLDKPIGSLGGDSEGLKLGDIIKDEKEGLEKAEVQIAVRQAMQVLNERQREVVRLRYWEELSQERIARIMDINQATVARALASALRIMEPHLKS